MLNRDQYFIQFHNLNFRISDASLLCPIGSVQNVYYLTIIFTVTLKTFNVFRT
jgi:hypothetical protein